ncbi:MAG: OmpH family outer membrane protein [Mangrovimonas sp.]|nr:OmpH family outer membrane protein [Mangrovimonas sp.]MCB0436851.1 OmpH family outer membrane protein [Mangrovimonas sp.]MCB0437177.1 OmpH family outer membrane protein [Mangrovimonas sp.]HPF97176.1 OmpH family outer membrane protein [Mangrovimonas sp.]
MKNVFYLSLLVILFSSCQKQQKIGFVDNGEVINNYQEKLDVEAKFKKKDEVFQKKTDSISKAFQLEAQDFQLKSKSMSQSQAQEKYDELGQKQQYLRQQLQFEQQQLQQQFNVEIDSVISKVREYVSDYGKKNGYTYILGKNEAGSVLYGTEDNDLTKTITDALNAEYKK